MGNGKWEMGNIKWLVVVGLAILYPLNIEAKINKKAGTTIGQVMEIGVGPRPVAMGEAFCAVADDLSAVYWNPAGIAQISKTYLGFAHTNWLEGINYDSVAGTYPLEEELGAVAISGVIMKIDNMVGRDNKGNLTNKFGAEDNLFTFSFGQMMNADMNLMWGINIKWFKQKIENEKTDGLVYDLGILYKFPEFNLNLGGAIQNLGSKKGFVSEKEDLPLNLKLGGVYEIKEKNLLVALDWNKPIAGNYMINLGGEWQTTRMLALRAGYKLSCDDLTSGLSFGIGLTWEKLCFDYAFTSAGELGDMHQASIAIEIGD